MPRAFGITNAQPYASAPTISESTLTGNGTAAGGSGSYTLGVHLKFLTAGQVTALKFFRVSTDNTTTTRSIRVWPHGGGTVLASATTTETASTNAWVTATLSPALAVAANQEIRIGYDTPGKPHAEATVSSSAAPDITIVQGCVSVAGIATYPDVNQGTNTYWADLIFVPGSAQPLSVGDTYWDTTTKSLYVFDGTSTQWVPAVPAPKTVTTVQARVQSSVAQSMPRATNIILTYNAAPTNVGGAWNAGAPDRLTIPAGAAGFYVFGGSFAYDAGGTATWCQCHLTVNATIVSQLQMKPMGYAAFSVSSGAYLQVGDYIQMNGYHDEPAAINTQANATNLWLARVA